MYNQKNKQHHHQRKLHHQKKMPIILSNEALFIVFSACIIFGYIITITCIQEAYKSENQINEISIEAEPITIDAHITNKVSEKAQHYVENTDLESFQPYTIDNLVYGRDSKTTTDEAVKDPSPMYGEISDSDKLLLEKVTYAEAGICSFEDQQGVAAVVLARSKERHQSIKEVIFATNQFSTAINGKIYNITSDGNIEVTTEMAKTMEEPVNAAIKDGAGAVADALDAKAIAQTLDKSEFGGEPLYFYTEAECSQKALNDRKNIRVEVKLDKMTFYRVWH